MKRFGFAAAAAALFLVLLAPSTLFAVDPVRSWIDPTSIAFPALDRFQSGLYIGTETNTGPARIVKLGDYGNFKSFPGSSSVNRIFSGRQTMTMYALTESAAVWKNDGTAWTQITPTAQGFSSNIGVYSGAFYKNSLYIGTGNPLGAQLWSYNGTAWSKLTIPGFSQNNEYISVMECDEDALYIGTINFSGGAELWKFDGATWTRLIIPGFTANNYCISSMVVFNKALHIGTANVSTGAELWRFNAAAWTKLTIAGLAANHSISSMMEYPGTGALYLGTTNYNGNTAQLWKFDGISGTRVNIPGFSANNIGILSMAMFNNALYFGTWNTSGAELWYLALMSPCAAVLANDFFLRIPAVSYNNQTYRANFKFDPIALSILFLNAGVVTDTGPFDSCALAALTLDLLLHLPDVKFQGDSYQADFRNSTGLDFVLTRALRF